MDIILSGMFEGSWWQSTLHASFVELVGKFEFTVPLKRLLVKRQSSEPRQKSTDQWRYHQPKYSRSNCVSKYNWLKPSQEAHDEETRESYIARNPWYRFYSTLKEKNFLCPRIVRDSRRNCVLQRCVEWFLQQKNWFKCVLTHFAHLSFQTDWNSNWLICTC